MNLRAVSLLLLCSFFSPLVLSQTKKTAKVPLLFTVNKKPVTAAEFTYLYKKNHQNPTEDYTRAKIEEYMNLYMNFKLKVEEARHRGMDTTEAFKKEFNQYKEELRKPYLPGNGLLDSLVRMTYDRMKEEIRASHILVLLKQDATPGDTLKAFSQIVEIRKKIADGMDFTKAADEFSEDQSVKVNHGDLGYFTALQMVYPFENAAYSTAVGKVSEPIRTRFGYHLLKITDRRPTAGEVEVSHIMIRTREDQKNDDVRNLIFSIYDQLQAGAKWEELCKQYSQDPGTKENGGRLRPFRSGMMTQVPEFERVAFELEKPGSYSDPFQTQYGWHIMRLERKIPLGSFEELAPGLRSKVTRDERAELSKQALQTRLRTQMGFTEMSATKSRLLGSADSTLTKGAWKRPQDKVLQKESLFVLKEKTYKVAGFFDYVQKNHRKSSLSPSKYMEVLYNNFVDETIMALQEEQIKKTYPEYQYLLNEYYEGILLFEIMEKEVWNKASEDSAGQHLYFMAHTDNYIGGDRARAAIYSVSDTSAMNGLVEEMKSENTKQIQEYCNKNKIKTESGFFRKEDRPVFELIKWEKGIHNAEIKGMYYLVWFKEILPPGKMSFEEARPAVVSDFQTYLEESWLEKLRGKYKVVVDPAGKAYVISQLEKK
jgi:peptidyl-prolyl cis-trans isomerase SurA